VYTSYVHGLCPSMLIIEFELLIRKKNEVNGLEIDF